MTSKIDLMYDVEEALTERLTQHSRDLSKQVVITLMTLITLITLITLTILMTLMTLIPVNKP